MFKNTHSVRSKKFLFHLILLFFTSSLFAQIGTQKQSIRTGVTFQWSDTQNGNNDNPATIQSVTIDGLVYNTFVVPSSYELTRLGRAGHGTNKIWLNGTQTATTSVSANGGPNSTWNSAARAAFQS